jgi:putative Ca2+/H+ antiporter (TMEM165/GDT1 family)
VKVKDKTSLMDWKIFVTIFIAVFIAELGDKTQLATMLFATDKEVSKYTVFFAASAALIVASAIGVLAGSFFAEYINEKYLHYIAGIGFILIGAFTLYNA